MNYEWSTWNQATCRWILLTLLCCLCAACTMAPAVPVEENAVTTTTIPPVGTDTSAAVPAAVELPNEWECLFAGTGATLAFEGQHLNYTCTDPSAPTTAVLGFPGPNADGSWQVEKASIMHGDDGFGVADSTPTTATVTGIELEDGTLCLFAGEGATLALDEKRLNYTCSTEGDTIIGLIGELQPDAQTETAGTLTAELATIVRKDTGFSLDSSETVTVTPVMLLLSDGVECSFTGRGATLTFEGQRANYTCTDPDADILGLLGEPSVADDGTMTVEQAVISSSDSGFELASSETITAALILIALADGTVCAFAGTGATLAFEEQRVTYNCSEGEPETVLLGFPNPQGAGAWSVDKATIGRNDSGFVLDAVEEEMVVRMTGGNLLNSDDSAVEVPGERSDLTDTVWYWEQSTASDGSINQPGNSENYMLTFQSGGQFLLQADCNRGSGTYAVEGSEFAIEGIVLTRMACPEESLDELFLSQLEKAISYYVEDGKLVLELAPESGSMTFAPATETGDTEAAVTGTVTYLQRMALPDTAEVTVQLVDVSLADAPAQVLAEQKILADGQQVPFAFELLYDPDVIEENRTYAVQARIEVAGELWFINTTQVPVITRGNPTQVELVLERV